MLELKVSFKSRHLWSRRPRQSKSSDKHALEAQAKKAIHIDDSTAEAIAEQKRLFREKFGREPGPDDPLLLNPESAVPEFLGDEALEETWRALVQAAGESGMDPPIGLRDEQDGTDCYRAEYGVPRRFRPPRME